MVAAGWNVAALARGPITTLRTRASPVATDTGSVAGAPTTRAASTSPPPSSVSVATGRSEEHTSELQSRLHLVCRLLLGKKKHTSELQSRLHLVCRLLLESENHTP